MNSTRAAVLSSYRPRLVPLEENLIAAVFPFMKIVPAEFCLRQAEEEGWITPQHLIVETSSGNMALGLAVVCNLNKYRLTVVSDYAVDGFLRRRLEDLGARVEIVSAPAPTGGYQRARLNKVAEVMAETPDSWWVNQYDNPAGPAAYSTFAAQLIDEVGRLDYLIGTVGSGGSVCGTGSFLRELFPDMGIVGVDTFGSVLFGHQDRPRTLRGLGNSILPKNLEHTLFDEVHWVTAAEAYTATRILHQQTSLFCGGTSGAAWLVARMLSRKNPKARIVFICPDDGYRYTDTVYSDEYLIKNNLWLTEMPKFPRLVDHPLDAGPGWSCMRWARRTLSMALAGKLAVPAAV